MVFHRYAVNPTDDLAKRRLKRFSIVESALVAVMTAGALLSALSLAADLHQVRPELVGPNGWLVPAFLAFVAMAVFSCMGIRLLLQATMLRKYLTSGAILILDRSVVLLKEYDNGYGHRVEVTNDYRFYLQKQRNDQPSGIDTSLPPSR